jgi:hypothetical protein
MKWNSVALLFHCLWINSLYATQCLLKQWGIPRFIVIWSGAQNVAFASHSCVSGFAGCRSYYTLFQETWWDNICGGGLKNISQSEHHCQDCWLIFYKFVVNNQHVKCYVEMHIWVQTWASCFVRTNMKGEKLCPYFQDVWNWDMRLPPVLLEPKMKGKLRPYFVVVWNCTTDQPMM